MADAPDTPPQPFTADEADMMTGEQVVDLYAAAALMHRAAHRNETFEPAVTAIRSILGRAQAEWADRVPAVLEGNVRRAQRADNFDELVIARQVLADAKADAIRSGGPYVLSPTQQEFEAVVNAAADVEQGALHDPDAGMAILRLFEHLHTVAILEADAGQGRRGLRGARNLLRRRRA